MGGRSTGSAAIAPADERARLDQVAEWYDSRRGLSAELVRHAADRILAHARGERALELGCATGAMTERLASAFDRLHVVEAAARYAEYARRLLPPEGRVYHCLFEEFHPTHRYDAIIMTWILEHIADPRSVLARARDWLSPDGFLYVVVPNAESVHRRVGLEMGMLARLDEINASDLAIGHRRVYTWDTLAADLAAAGLRAVSMSGILLKPLPSAMMETWAPELIDAFFALSGLAPRWCSEIFAICRPCEG